MATASYTPVVLPSTTLLAAANAGATSIFVASRTGFATGQSITLAANGNGQEIATIAGGYTAAQNAGVIPVSALSNHHPMGDTVTR